jgi:hypothetical protein
MTGLRGEDFDEADRELTYVAGAHLLSKAHDLVRHHHDGDGWAPWPQDNAAELAKQAHDLIDRMDQAVKEARRLLADAERPARLRAMRRERQGRAHDRSSSPQHARPEQGEERER